MCVKFRSLDAVCRYVLRISLSRLCPCFSFRPPCRDVSIQRFRILQSCCVEWFSRWLVLRLFPLPCHVVCHTFVWARAALDQTGYWSNSARSAFSFANVFCQSSFCNDWFWTPISAWCKHLKKKHLKKHKTNFSNISKTLTKLLKHVKDTKQASQTSPRHRTNISNTSNCVTKVTRMCTSS